MSIHPITLFLPMLVALAFAFGGLRAAFLCACVSVPFRTSAVLSAGGLNILAEHLAFALIIGAAGAAALLRKPSAKPRGRVEVEQAVLFLLISYVFLSALFLPNVFRDIWVVNPSLTFAGEQRYANNVPGLSLSPLRPSSANFTQPAYTLFSALVFVVAVRLGRKHGYALLDRGLAIAATVHAGLGLADIIGLDSILSIVRTASYRINDSHQMLGLDRTIGAMVEASRYGILAGILFSYFFALWLMRGGKRNFRLAALLFVTGLSTLSTSAFLCIAAAFTVLAARFLFASRVSRLSSYRIGALLAVFLLSLSAILALTPAGPIVVDVVNSLVFNKADSDSGLVRSASLRLSLTTLRDTWYLGAGAGSVVSNGLPFVWLGNIGLPGTILFVLFFFLVMRGRGRLKGQNPADYHHWFAATTAVAVYLIGEGASRTLLDPGIASMLISAMAVTTRRPLWISTAATQMHLSPDHGSTAAAPQRPAVNSRS